jgi:hypothetical protein
MGANLYITKLYRPQREQWEPLFDEAVQRRDGLTAGSEEHRQAQARVEECYEKLHEQGYFRDSYNDWNVLWKFGLSWWEDVIPMLDDESGLSVEQARNLLGMLKQRENVFALKLAVLPAEDQRYFRGRYASLQEFLNQAIELDTTIDASL